MWICELLFEFLCVWITVLFICLSLFLPFFVDLFMLKKKNKSQQQHRTEKVSSCSSEIILIKSGCHQFTIKVKRITQTTAWIL